MQHEQARLAYEEGFRHYEDGKPEQALEPFRTACRLAPGSGDAWTMLGNALVKLGRLDPGVQALRRAVALRPKSALFHVNLALGLRKRGERAAARAAFERAIELEPGHAVAHFGLGMLLLQTGDYERGWDEMEWRLRLDQPLGLRDVPLPEWRGGTAEGRRLFVHAEQGYGDTVQFARYLPLLKSRGAREVIFCCDARLERLFRGFDGFDRYVTKRRPPPEADCHVPLMSLPQRMGTRADSVPAQLPYLRADPADLQRWRARIEGAAGPARGRRIGLSWAGRPGHVDDRFRSMELATLAPILDACPDDTFVSLQVGPPAAQAAAYPRIVDLSSDPQDIADAAAIIGNLDLVISVDTAMAHVAGALGKPVWTLLGFDPDWRWGVAGESTPWYPGMRLLRQQAPGDWRAPVEAARRSLAG